MHFNFRLTRSGMRCFPSWVIKQYVTTGTDIRSREGEILLIHPKPSAPRLDPSGQNLLTTASKVLTACYSSVQSLCQQESHELACFQYEITTQIQSAHCEFAIHAFYTLCGDIRKRYFSVIFCKMSRPTVTHHTRHFTS